MNIKATAEPFTTAGGTLGFMLTIEGAGSPFTMENTFDNSAAAERAAREFAKVCGARCFDFSVTSVKDAAQSVEFMRAAIAKAA